MARLSIEGRILHGVLFLLLKARELSHHLVGKRKAVEFVKPVYEIERHDSDEIRKKILDISYTDWKKQGFSEGTLHQLKQKVKANEYFTLNKQIRERLENWNNEVAGVEGQIYHFTVKLPDIN